MIFFKINNDVIKVDDEELLPVRKDEKIWSLWANHFGEVNAYRLTFQEAVGMVIPAIEEDGFRIDDLVIFAPYKNEKAEQVV